MTGQVLEIAASRVQTRCTMRRELGQRAGEMSEIDKSGWTARTTLITRRAMRVVYERRDKKQTELIY